MRNIPNPGVEVTCQNGDCGITIDHGDGHCIQSHENPTEPGKIQSDANRQK